MSPDRFHYSELDHPVSKCDSCEQEVVKQAPLRVSKKHKKKRKSGDQKAVSTQIAIPQIPALKRRSILSSEVSSLDTLHDVASEWESETQNDILEE